MTPAEALAFVCSHGVALESASGPVPSLAAAIAGKPIRGSWWSHERAREIFAATQAIRASPQVLVCRIIDGRITYVHRRLWPALVRLSARFPPAQLAQVREVHSATGKHVLEAISFPAWVPPDVSAGASELDENSAIAQLGAWCAQDKPRRKGARRQ